MQLFDLARIERDAGLAELEYHDEIGSTNSRALEIAQTPDRRLPLLILADRQLAGRGRGQNRWWAGQGSLIFSLLVDRTVADFPRKNWPLVSLTTALSVAEVLEGLIPTASVRIKWPNDVFVNGRKLCGILVETLANRPDLLVIGVGVNVNNSLAGAPPELRSTATSLVDLASRPFDRSDLLIEILRRLLQWLPTLEGDAWPFAEAWRERCYLQGRTIQLDSGGRMATGVCQGIDDQGALLLLTEGGIQRFFGGVVAKIL